MLCYLILQRIHLKNNGKWYNSPMAEKIFHSIGGSRGKADHPGQGQKPVSRISVRTLVEFLLRSGDLDSRAQRGMDVEAALAGGRIHRKLQKAEKGDYAAEVMLSRDTEWSFLPMMHRPVAERKTSSESTVTPFFRSSACSSSGVNFISSES